MVPQDGEDAKPRGRKTDAPKAPRHETKYGPVNLDGPASNDGAEGRAWHEASVGTLAYYDAAGKHLRTVYTARMPESKMATLAQELEAELNHALAQRPDLNVVLASDGDAHQWQILEGIAARIRPRVLGRIMFLLDFYHAAEHLGSAAGAVYGTTSKRRLVASAEWRETLKDLDDGPERVLKTLRYYRDEATSNAAREKLETEIDYLANHKRQGRLQYAQAQADNLPIGTGVTEAAAKTVVAVRMRRAGARYSQHGGQAILIFRTAILSHRFPQLASILERSYTARVEVRRAA